MFRPPTMIFDSVTTQIFVVQAIRNRIGLQQTRLVKFAELDAAVNQSCLQLDWQHTSESIHHHANAHATACRILQ